MADVSAENELCDIVDETGLVIGTAPRSRCHGEPALIHRAAHVLVFNRLGEVLLQKRAADKLIQPDRWDSSVGGHLDQGEDFRSAAVREMSEELGVTGVPLTFLFGSQIRNQVESENVETFLAIHNGPFEYCRKEISEIRFWTAAAIDEAMGTGVFTPNFEDEWRLFLDWCRRYPLKDTTGNPFCAGDSFPDLFRTLY